MTSATNQISYNRYNYNNTNLAELGHLGHLDGAGEGNGVGGRVADVVSVRRAPAHAEPPRQPALAHHRAVQGVGGSAATDPVARTAATPANAADPHVLGPPLVAERPGLV